MTVNGTCGRMKKTGRFGSAGKKTWFDENGEEE